MEVRTLRTKNGKSSINYQKSYRITSASFSRQPFPNHKERQTQSYILSLLSGRNPEYLIGQQVKGATATKESGLEVIPTGYVLIDGGSETAVQRVSETKPLAQYDIETIVATALAGQFLGKKCIYLEAGSGAQLPVHPEVITAVKTAIDIPLIVGGGIRSSAQMQLAREAGADLVVIGTAFETDTWNETSV